MIEASQMKGFKKTIYNNITIETNNFMRSLSSSHPCLFASVLLEMNEEVSEKQIQVC
jgi:hypothetical protein